MSRTDFRKLLSNLTILIVLVVCLIYITDSRLFELSTAMGQSQKKSITHPQWKNQPVEFFKIKTTSKTLSFKTASVATEHREEIDSDGDDNWLKGLVVHLRNRSNKNIIYFNFHLTFPETDVSGARLSHSLHFGSYPEKPSEKPSENQNTVASTFKVLKPGEETEIALSDYDHTAFYDLLQRHNLTHVTDLHIILQQVIFDDDTSWLGGSFFKRDPLNPDAWVNVDNQPQQEKPQQQQPQQ
jgi:hypothetical protein